MPDGLIMKTSDFDYELPQDLIAQTPSEPRDHSRLMLLERNTGRTVHRMFYDLPDCLREGDLLVFNDSRVFPARLYGRSDPSGREIELLLLSRHESGDWRALVKPGRRMRTGSRFVVHGADGGDEARGEVVGVEQSGSRLVRFESEPDLSRVGHVPLPPYIRKRLRDSERYQTVYSSVEGSVAAPTAGLHFTRSLLDKLDDMGVRRAFVTLHVGWDSFRPVTSENPSEHEMHSEYWELSAETADAINSARDDGRRIISVGTTAVRLLENAALVNRKSGASTTLSTGRLVSPGSGWADLFITPGFEFRVIDGLVTNFHLPRSTLLMLVSAFAGRGNMLRAYETAVRERYRFYSFGDAMLIH